MLIKFSKLFLAFFIATILFSGVAFEYETICGWPDYFLEIASPEDGVERIEENVDG